jgi:hypothetical protein
MTYNLARASKRYRPFVYHSGFKTPRSVPDVVHLDALPTHPSVLQAHCMLESPLVPVPLFKLYPAPLRPRIPCARDLQVSALNAFGSTSWRP